MGFVIVTKSDGAFTPGTTALNASNVTATYTDGFHSTRDRPESALVAEDGYLYLREKPDDIYLFEGKKIIKPDSLSGDSSTPDDVRWGPAIAYGTAIAYKTKEGESIEPEKVNIFNEHINFLNGNRLLQQTRNRRAKPRC